MMHKLFKRFCDQDHGGVTADYVLLTGGILSLAIAVLATVSTGTTKFAEDTGVRLAQIEIDAG